MGISTPYMSKEMATEADISLSQDQIEKRASDPCVFATHIIMYEYIRLDYVDIIRL